MLNYLLFLLLPAYLLRFSITPFVSVNLLELLLLVTILKNFHAILKIAPAGYLFRKIKQRRHILLPVALILIGFVLGYLRQQFLTGWVDWTDGFGKLLDLIILPIVYGFSLVMLVQLKKVSLQGLLYGYYLGAVLTSVLGLIYLAHNWLTFDGRLSTFFQSPNELAIFIAPAILIGLYLIRIMERNIKLKVLLLFSLFLLSFILYQTFSLGAWLSISLSILYLFLSVRNSFLKPYLGLILFTITTIALIAILNIDLLLRAFDYQPNAPATSYDSRLAIYQVDQKIISTNWLYGIGINNFQNVYLGQQKYFEPYPQWAVPHAHNNIMHTWLEGGLLAVIGLFFLLYNVLLSKNNSLSSLESLLALLFSSIFIYFILHGLVDTTFWTPSAAILFFFVVIFYPYEITTD